MAFKTIGLTDELQQYVLDHSRRSDPIIDDLTAETRSAVADVAHFQIAPEQAPFFEVLVRSLNVRSAIEVGTFTGLSALTIARNLAPGGTLICCDISEEYTAIARKYWARAGVADRVDLRIGPAAETLHALPADEAFDLAFIDADKVGYPVYWAEIVPRIRAGGVILVDNVLRGGRVVGDPSALSEDDKAVLAFNDMVVRDERVIVAMIPVADGLTYAVKK